MSLTAGASRGNITPPVGFPQAGFATRERGSEAVDDDLFGKALVLSDDDTEVALLCADLIDPVGPFVSRVRELVRSKVGIPENQVMVCSSHTHFGPRLRKVPHFPHPAQQMEFSEAYIENAARILAGAVFLAHQNRREVRVGFGVGTVTCLSFNRRSTGTESTVPIDPDVFVARLDDVHGDPVAALISFGCHPVCGGEERLYALSADYPGVATKLVEQIRGGVCLFALGCAGDVNPVARGQEARMRLGTAVGAEALKVLAQTKTTANARLHLLSKSVDLPLRPLPSAGEAERACQEAEERLSRWQREGGDVSEGARLRQALMRAVRLLDLATDAGGKNTVAAEVHAIGIGDWILLLLPGEVFAEIGLEIKQQHPNVFVFSQCNHYLCYVPPLSAYEAGGYEIEWTPLGRGAAEQLRDVALELVEQMRGVQSCTSGPPS